MRQRALTLMVRILILFICLLFIYSTKIVKNGFSQDFNIVRGTFTGTVIHINVCDQIGCENRPLPPELSIIGIGDHVTGVFSYDIDDATIFVPDDIVYYSFEGSSPATTFVSVTIDGITFTTTNTPYTVGVRNYGDHQTVYQQDAFIIEARYGAFQFPGSLGEFDGILIQLHDIFAPFTLVSSTSLPTSNADIDPSSATSLQGHAGSTNFQTGEYWEIVFSIDPNSITLAKLPPSNCALDNIKFFDVLQNSVTVEALGGGIVATFKPNCGLTLAEAAVLGGYDHFNWLQVVFLDEALAAGSGLLTGFVYCNLTGLLDQNGNCPEVPFIDPPHGGYEYQRQDCSNVNGYECDFPVQDNLDWYWDEEFRTDFVRGMPTEFESELKPSSCTNFGNCSELPFDDSPTTTTFNFFFGTCNAGFDQQFHTVLVGVLADGTGRPLYYPGTAFDWQLRNRFCGSTDILIERRKNTDSTQTVPDAIAEFGSFVMLDEINEQILALYVDRGIQIELPVEIDIKPGEYPNSINYRNKGKIPVAVLTTDTFDATTIDPKSIKFGQNEPMKFNGKGHVEDVDGDGDNDLLLHFNTKDMGFQCGDTSASLMGRTFDGQVAITGFDSVNMVGCK